MHIIESATRLCVNFTTTSKDKYLVDYKNHDMRKWEKAEVNKNVKEFLKQMTEYKKSDDTPEDSEAIIVATCPPTDKNIREDIRKGLAKEHVKVVFCESAEIDDVVNDLKKLIPEDEE